MDINVNAIYNSVLLVSVRIRSRNWNNFQIFLSKIFFNFQFSTKKNKKIYNFFRRINIFGVTVKINYCLYLLLRLFKHQIKIIQFQEIKEIILSYQIN